jgi:hypothetical protein
MTTPHTSLRKSFGTVRYIRRLTAGLLVLLLASLAPATGNGEPENGGSVGEPALTELLAQTGTPGGSSSM